MKVYEKYWSDDLSVYLIFFWLYEINNLKILILNNDVCVYLMLWKNEGVFNII